MKQALMIIVLLLVHNESGDVDIVKKCDFKEDMLIVDFGYGATGVELPADEYTCSMYKKL